MLLKTLFNTFGSSWVYSNNLYEITVKDWFSIFESFDFSLLVKNKTLRKLLKWANTYPKDVIDFWNDINDHSYKEFGISDHIKDRLRLKIKITELNYKQVATKNRMLENDINVLKMDLEAMEKGRDVKAPKLYELLGEMEKYYGFPMSNDMKVFDFISRRKAMANGGV